MTPDQMLRYGKGLGLWREPVEQSVCLPEPVFLQEPANTKPPPKKRDKADTTSATEVHVPIRVYQSSTRPGKNADGSTAEDMLYGEYTASQIRAIETVGGTRAFQSEDMSPNGAKEHFDTWRRVAGRYFSSGDLKMVVLAMIGQAQANAGGEFRHPALTKAVRGHPKTQAFVQNILDGVKAKIKAEQGDINKLTLEDWHGSYPSKPKLPAFNKRLGFDSDLMGGLTMAVNGVWAGDATITKFERAGNHYRANVQVTFYDHFGLDLPDVGPDPTNGHIKEYSLLSVFRSWFIVQHLDIYAYKPFITVMEMNYPIQGEW
ncbi:hypothetical protein HNP12_000194 [Aeromonas hydrophila]|uniref:DUF3289 family protein n=1 Tax=Aeromonas hydrophila TaxID=644 RepID=UPI0021690F1D|nr:DUF3289 family protein [Aeromonas hydrophila]MCS3766155.1 hypothetical protein [Aeromonas hydrophila]